MIEYSNSLTDSQKVNIQLVTLAARVCDLEKDIISLLTLVKYGNGELPLVEKVRNHDKFIIDLKFWFRTITIALVLQTITFVGASLIYLIKLIPLLESLSKLTP
jgi:hypothetical protein